MNINVSDKFFEAVEEYNTSIRKFKPENKYLLRDNNYRRGMLFTCLRRQFNICKRITRNYAATLRVGDIECTFNNDHTLKSITINKNLIWNHSWDNEGNDNVDTIAALKKITDKHTTIYSTRALNSLAQVFNQL